MRGVLGNFVFNMTPFCIYFGFVAPSFSSFSKIVFFCVAVIFGWLFDYVSRSLWSIQAALPKQPLLNARAAHVRDDDELNDDGELVADPPTPFQIGMMNQYI